MTDYNQPCSDSLNIIDSYSRVVAYKKDVSESGLVPDSLLYPSNILVPFTPIAFYDVCTNSSSKNLSDAFVSTDVIGPYAIGKGLQNSIAISDASIKEFTKSLAESGRVPENTLYPAFDFYPEGGINVNDVVGSGFSRLLDESFIIDTAINSFGITKYYSESIGIDDSNTKAIGKYLYEVGISPSNTLYPAFDFYPEGVLRVIDAVAFGFFRSLSDSFNINDVDGINFGINKGLNDDINIHDIILFNIYLYLEENTNILDEISNNMHIQISDNFIIEDDIIKNIARILSESMIIDDDMEKVLRTLVRATLRAIKCSGSTLRSI